MRLPGPLYGELLDALTDAFPEYEELNRMLRRSLGKRLNEIEAPKGQSDVVGKVITWAESEGRIIELVLAARDTKPSHAELQAVARKIDIPKAGEVVKGTPERITLPNVQFNNVEDWVVRLQTLKWRVCRVEYAPGQPMGTGFLVAPDVVMTNWHVVDEMRRFGVQIDRDHSPEPARVRFDYIVPAGAEDPVLGQEVHLLQGCLIAESEAPDFALLRLAGKPGNDGTPDGPRGWISLNTPQPPLVAGDPVLILQHPLGDPIKLTIGSVRQVPPPGASQVTYTANTDSGSSGSPCLTSQLDPFALHYQGSPEVNTGWFLSKIREILSSEVKQQIGS
jgi:hypothetical protein